MSDYSRNLENILEQLPSAAKTWMESLPWQHRRSVLSRHMVCAADPERQAEFLDDYTADGLMVKLADQETWQRVCHHLSAFQLKTDLSEAALRGYIRQFYIHSAQDQRCQSNLYLQSALKPAFNPEERNSIFSYVLGFELLRMMFGMSWLQHEKLYRLQRKQEDFFNCYIKPIQAAHRLNGIIVPKDAGLFFAKRSYFVQQPVISPRKLTILTMATFTVAIAAHLGFMVIRHPNSLCFDYDEIFEAESEPFAQVAL